MYEETVFCCFQYFGKNTTQRWMESGRNPNHNINGLQITYKKERKKM